MHLKQALNTYNIPVLTLKPKNKFFRIFKSDVNKNNEPTKPKLEKQEQS